MTTTEEISSYFNLIAVGLTLAADGVREDRFTPTLRRQAGAAMQILSNSRDLALVLHEAVVNNADDPVQDDGLRRPSWSGTRIGADEDGCFIWWELGTLGGTLTIRPAFDAPDEDARLVGWEWTISLPDDSVYSGGARGFRAAVDEAAMQVTDLCRAEGVEVRGG